MPNLLLLLLSYEMFDFIGLLVMVFLNGLQFLPGIGS